MTAPTDAASPTPIIPLPTRPCWLSWDGGDDGVLADEPGGVTGFCWEVAFALGHEVGFADGPGTQCCGCADFRPAPRLSGDLDLAHCYELTAEALVASGELSATAVEVFLRLIAARFSGSAAQLVAVAEGISG